jgi:hypothetical protein
VCAQRAPRLQASAQLGSEVSHPVACLMYEPGSGHPQAPKAIIQEAA